MDIRRTWSLLAPWHRTSQFRWHHCTRGFHDLPDALAGQADTKADCGEALTSRIAREDDGVSPLNATWLDGKNLADDPSSGLVLRSQLSALATHAAEA